MSLPALDITDADSLSGIRRTLHWDESERKLVVESFQECGDALAFNQALFNADRSSTSLWAGRGYVKVASIPNIVLEQWMKRDGLSIFRTEDRPKIMARLSSNEYSHLRTAPGRLA
jgi:hypothetical protein